MENDNRKRNDSVFSRKIRAGRRRTYFFDVRTTRGNDYYLTITESKKRFDGNGYERHKLFIYKEDFNKFIEELGMAVDHIKGLMPDFDFDAFNHKYDEEGGNGDHYGNDHHSDMSDHQEEMHEEEDQPMEQHDNSDNEQSNDNPISFSDDDLKL